MGLRSHWIQNSLRDSGVSFMVGGLSAEGTARVVDRKKEARLAAEVAALMKSKYNWSGGIILELSPSRRLDGSKDLT